MTDRLIEKKVGVGIFQRFWPFTLMNDRKKTETEGKLTILKKRDIKDKQMNYKKTNKKFEKQLKKKTMYKS